MARLGTFDLLATALVFEDSRMTIQDNLQDLLNLCEFNAETWFANTGF